MREFNKLNSDLLFLPMIADMEAYNQLTFPTGAA